MNNQNLSNSKSVGELSNEERESANVEYYEDDSLTVDETDFGLDEDENEDSENNA